METGRAEKEDTETTYSHSCKKEEREKYDRRLL